MVSELWSCLKISLAFNGLKSSRYMLGFEKTFLHVLGVLDQNLALILLFLLDFEYVLIVYCIRVVL